MRRRRSFRTSVTARSSSGCIQFSESEVLAGSSASRNGSSEHSYSWDSGIRQPAFWALSAELRRLYPPQRSFLLYPAASAGGFPAMSETGAFLMKDFVLLAV